jgi:hypothetical protein
VIGVPGGAGNALFRSGGNGRVAQSPALPLDATAWGCRFFDTLAAGQDLVHQTRRSGGLACGAESRAVGETRIGGMAAPVS